MLIPNDLASFMPLVIAQIVAMYLAYRVGIYIGRIERERTTTKFLTPKPQQKEEANATEIHD